ncbi:MAG: two-component system response regulator, partial [Kofleriaceae bacterium]|nr:two-component system response regulator [Kofleriaceae bacterium]
NMLRILLTARADVHLAVRALNEGAVHRFLLKPWDHVDLKGIVRMALHSMHTQDLAPRGGKD